MNESTTFEGQLATLFQAFAEGAPVEVDAVTMAASIASGRPRRLVDRSPLVRRWLVPVLIGLLLVALAVSAAVVGAWLHRSEPLPRPHHGAFVPATDMSESRTNPTLVALADGKVLISGGSPAEVYDPATNTTQAVPGDAPTGETNSAVLLKNGRVLLINYDGNQTSSRAWMFDTAALRFHDLPQPDGTPGVGLGVNDSPPFGVRPGLALLPDGEVLIAGGTDNVYKPKIVASAMLFDPDTETFSPTGSMTVPRRGQSMTALRDGRILVAGGSTFDPPRVGLSTRGPSTLLSTAEIYDPGTGTFTPTSDMAHVVGPNESLLMPDGRVLVYTTPPEPFSDPSKSQAPVALDVYDPVTGTFTEAGTISRAFDKAAVLPDGGILLSGAEHYTERQDDPAGGYYLYDLYRPWAAILDLQDGSLTAVAPPSTTSPGTLTLPDGRVLFAGGVTYPSQPQSLGVWDSVTEPWMEIFQ